MTCPKCRSHNAESIARWTISAHKMTIPRLDLWACANQDCRHQWPRELNSPVPEVPPDRPSRQFPEGSALVS